MSSPPSPRDLAGLAPAVAWLEVRADRIETAGWRRDLRGRLDGVRLLYSLRSRARGGRGPGDPAARRRRLREAARSYELVELEAERDLVPEILTGTPVRRRMISWQGPAAALEDAWRRLSAFPARLYKLVVRGQEAGDALAALTFLEALRRSDVVAYSGGEAGFWTRLVAPHFGSPLVFAPLGRGETLPGVGRLIVDYGVPARAPVTSVFGIAGRGILRSLSPRLHNAAYRALGLEALYLPFAAETFAGLWCAVDGFGELGVPLSGLTVVAPHKQAAAAAVVKAGGGRAASAAVRQSGGANLLFRSAGGAWRADSTDPIGVLDPLRRRRIAVRGRPVAVVGCGGSGRAIAAALDDAGARLVLVNRSRDRGREAAADLGLSFVALADFDPSVFAVVVNATPVGGNGEAPPFAVGRLANRAAVVDLVYGAEPTPLAAAARCRGLTVIDGREVLLAQTRRQIHSMTGRTIDDRRLRSFLDTPSR